MNIRHYKSKRDLTSSKEPLEKRILRRKGGALRFVVQKHAARRLHYDFRLELDGVLKSWAIPKGPSLNPKVKRLAVEVEDHPIDYGNFEGVIPKGHYGAGKVEIWDKGTYEPSEESEDPEKLLKKELKKGEIKIVLSGKKLKGKFVLVKTRKDFEKNQWLLIKTKDDFATTEEIIGDITITGSKKAPLPHHISPMLAAIEKAPFDSPDWIYEVKWDGCRAIGEVDGSKVRLYSRNFKLFNAMFPKLVRELEKAKARVILDGEVVVLDKDGKPSFQLLQQYIKSGKGNLRYYIFDLIFVNGRDLRHLPLLERKKELKEFLLTWNHPLLCYCEHVEDKGKLFFNEAKKLGLEGIIAKKKDSIYLSKRSDDWLKIKSRNGQEAIIVGYTEPKGGRNKFGSLLLGARQGDNFVFIGHVGTGFDDASLNEIFQKMQPLITNKCPLKPAPKSNTPAVWLKPKLICEVGFTEWTADNRMRHPVFLGLRQDKSSNEVYIEGKDPDPASSKKINSELNFLSNQAKVFWKKKGYTKGDMVEYYSSISTFILPYLKRRPLVLHRFPDGAEGKEFYQKEAPEFTPSWMETVVVEHSEKEIRYLMVSDKRSLLYVVNLGCIELHPFLSPMQGIESPDFAVLDLDPENISFKAVIHVAETMHEILEEINVPHYCKTSGKRGLHIYIPLGRKYSYQQSQNFAEILARLTYRKLPKITSLIRNPQKRQKKVYIDYLQNSLTKTVVAPYSLRPTPEATVSTPLEWAEVEPQLDPREWNIKTVAARLREKGDVFKPILRGRINLKAVLSKMELLLMDHP